MNPYYRDYSDFLAGHFEGKVQKLTVNAGFSCPNRDGTIGRGGCSYCINASFTPGYCRTGLDVAGQIEAGKRFFARKYPKMRYLAYFQAYTSTYGASVGRLLDLYGQALEQDGVVGLVIGTRPDCVNTQLLRGLRSLGGWVMVEYGAESAHDSTLRAVNRGHTWAQTVEAVMRTRSQGIHTGLHLINGLPGESIAMMMQTVDAVGLLAPDVVKFHQLQLLRGARLSQQVARGESDIHRFTLEEYVALCADIVRRLPRGVAIDRFVSQAPDDMLIYPRWGVKNHEFTALLHRRLDDVAARQL